MHLCKHLPEDRARPNLTIPSYAYECGLFGPVLPLLKIAEDYCTSHEDCELILVDLYWTKGSLFTDTNQFEACYESFQAEHAWLEKAVQKGLVQLPNIRQVFALGGLGNGLQSLNRFKEAEECYRAAFRAWEHVPGDRKIYVSGIPTHVLKVLSFASKTANLCYCLWHLGKLEEAEKLLLAVITDWNDASSFRYACHLIGVMNNTKLDHH